MMKELLLVCVNYNSYRELEAYLKSISAAKKKSISTKVTVYIADNSTSFQEVDVNCYQEINVQQVRFNNIGYIGAAQSVINGIKDIHKYDYTIISNVDILMDVSFIARLESLQIQQNIGWIAPSIKSLLIGRDKNPSVFKRYPKWKLIALKFSYNPLILYFYEKIYYNSKQQGINFPEQDIYAGHGSFFLFTKSFLKSYPHINYPIFLYGEELFFAELCKEARLRVRYIPSLIINDFEHVSTSKIHRSTYYKYNKKAISYILRRFY